MFCVMHQAYQAGKKGKQRRAQENPASKIKPFQALLSHSKLFVPEGRASG